MSEAGGVLLRIFTGPHTGAEIELGSASCLLGSAEDCDIILHDSSVAPHHAHLQVRPAPLRMGSEADAPPSPPVVYITPLEGTVRFNTLGPHSPHSPSKQAGQPVEGEPAPSIPAGEAEERDAGMPFPPGVPCFLGFTCIAWAVPDQAAASWEQVLRALEPLLNPGQQQGDEGDAQEEQQGDHENRHGLENRENREEREDPEGDTDDHFAAVRSRESRQARQARGDSSSQATGLTATANRVGEFFSFPGTAWRALLRRTPLLLATLLLASLCVGVGQRLENAPPSPDALRARLAAEGFTTLEVSRHADGLRVSGSLRDDAARGRLVRVVQSMQYPVRLDVHMERDAANALAAAFNSRGLYPEVGDDQKIAHALRVTGYMKDSIVEDWAFAGARDDLPALPKGENAITREIVYADKVDSVLRPALTRAGLQSMAVRYLPGTVEISGILDVERRKALESALREVRQELAIPLVVDVREGAPNLQASPGEPDTSAGSGMTASGGPAVAAPTRNAPSLPPAFSVTSVTMQPLRFITLSNGERVFEGGLLAGGYTLEDINTRQLTLRRNGQPTIYPLRGTHDAN